MKKIRWLLLLVLVGFFFYGLLPFSKQDPSKGIHPAWMISQVEEDLSSFKPLKKSDLIEFFLDTTSRKGLVYISLERGHVTFTHDPCPGQGTRLKYVKKFFKSLAQQYTLPDVSLLLSLEDAQDAHPGPVPLFVFAKNTRAKYNILFPDFEALRMGKKISLWSSFSHYFPWEQKKGVVFWRGATNGLPEKEDDIFSLPRVWLVKMSCAFPEWLDAAFTHFGQWDESALLTMSSLTKPLFPSLPIKDHYAYKYLIDIDGNSCTYERCRWILLSNSTLLKPESPNVQWYYKALSPFVHYVPLKYDLSDLPAVYDWLKTHDSEAKAIADKGRELGREIFSEKATKEYVATLLFQYAKLFVPEENRDEN